MIDAYGFVGKVEKLDLSKFVNTENFNENDTIADSCTAQNAGNGDQSNT